MKYKIEKNTVQETLILPLYSRKLCTELYPNLYRDETAVRLIDELDYDFSEAEKNSRCLMPRSAEQKPHAQQDRKEDQVGQGEQPEILLLPLWQLPCDLPVGNKTGHGCDQSAKTSQIGADDEGLCLCREPGQQQGSGNITGDLRSKNRHQHFPAGQKLLQPAGESGNAAKIANEDEKSHKGQKQGIVHRP